MYNYGLSLLKATWDIPEISGSDSKRLDAIKKVFTNITKKQTEYLWTNKYSSRIYQHAFINLKKAFSRWRSPKIKAELPRFKKKKHHCSFTVDSSNGKVLVTEGKKIKIPSQNCGQVMDRDLNGSINLENWTKNADSLSVNACGLEGAVSLG